MQATINFAVRRSGRTAGKRDRKAKSVNLFSVGEKSPTKRSLRNVCDYDVEETNQALENVDLSATPSKRGKIKRKVTPTKSKAECVNLYQLAKHLLSPSSISAIVGRENECNEVKQWIEKHLKCKTSASIYLSGPPGTGKSACVNQITSQLIDNYSFKLIHVNGMNVRNPTALYAFIANELNLKCTLKKDALNAIEKEIEKTKKQLLFVFDEIDNLTDKYKEALYTIFDWPRISEKVIVVGIANTLDFTSRTLSRFHSLQLDLIKEVYFHPYTKQQILDIINARLNYFQTQNIIKPIALELVARKVSSHNGDARKALNLCQKAVELIEIEDSRRGKDALKETNDDGFNKGSEQKLEPLSVGINHIMKVLNQVYGDEASRDSCNDISYLPLQQQIIICVCLMHSKFKRQKQIEISKCYDTFTRICTRKKIAFEVSNSSDFQSMCDLLEAKGFLCVTHVKDTIKVSLKMDETELSNLIAGKPLLKSLLVDDSFFLTKYF